MAPYVFTHVFFMFKEKQSLWGSTLEVNTQKVIAYYYKRAMIVHIVQTYG
jgi:hypothetical protein